MERPPTSRPAAHREIADHPTYPLTHLSPKGQPHMINGRVRTIATGVAALAVVAMLALLFRAFADARTGPDTSPGAAPGGTTQAVQQHGKWFTINALTFTTTQQGLAALPAVAPADTNTVYQATLSPVALRRTTDAGKHWTTLQIPGDTANTEAVQVFVSPLNAKTVFLTITSPLPPQSTESACPTLNPAQSQRVSLSSRSAATGSRPYSSALPKSGRIPCSLQYYSTDGGGSWTPLTLPIRSVLVDTTPMLAMPTAHLLHAQGPQLYAAAGCGPFCSGPSQDILTSADGGVHWTLADHAIRVAGHNVCDFDAAPGGNDVYAITSTQSCGSETVPTAYLWHSTDKGTHWTKVGALPANAWLGLAVVAQAQGQPLLYLHLPNVTVQGHGTSMTDGPTSLRVSANGGKTWTAAPAAGITATSRPYTGPLCVLSDGTVVENYGDPMTSALYGWKIGDAAWHQVTGQINGQVSQVLVVPQGGTDTLVAVTIAKYNQSGNTSTGETLTVQSYLP
jgi:hypothetical protein